MSDLGRRLSKYLYLADLLPRRSVLEVGCGNGDGARFLASRGAREVIGIDRSEAAVSAGQAAGLPRNVRLRAGSYRALDLADGSMDLVLVPDGAELLKDDELLDEIARVMADSAVLAFAVQAGDRGGRGAAYYDVVERLEPHFGPLRMLALSPFRGWSLVEYAQASGQPVDVALDATLADEAGGDPEVIEYVALAGDPSATRGFTVVQTPGTAEAEAAAAAARDEAQRRAAESSAQAVAATEARAEVASKLRAALVEVETLQRELGQREQLLARAGVEREALVTHLAEVEEAHRKESSAHLGEEVGKLRDAVALERKRRDELSAAAGEHARRAAELEKETGELARYSEELEAQLRRAEERAGDAERGLGDKTRRLEEALQDGRRLRSRVAQLDGVLLARRLSGAEGAVPPPMHSETPPESAAGGAGELSRVEELERDLARANQRWRAAEEKNDELWRKVGKAEQEAAEARESAARRAAEQRSQSAQALTRAMEEAGRKLASAQDEAARERRDAAQARAELASLRAELGAASGSANRREAELLRETVRLVSDAEERALAAETAVVPPTRNGEGGGE